MDNYSAEAQKFLNAGKAYETWVECVALYAGGETLAAVKKSQNYIKDVEKIMQHEKWASIVKRYGALSDAIICFFYTHIAVWASRVYRLDDEGNETNIGDAIMEEAMKMFTKLENFMQSDDHVLHLKLSLFSSKIKLLNLNMNKNQDDIDNLFREARAWSQKCGKTRECMHFKALIDVLDVILSFRSNKIGYADSKALEIWDSFSEEKLLNDKGISLELAILCLFHIEKSRLVEYSDEIQITYRQKCKMYLRNVFGRKLTKMHCRLFQSLAAISLHFEHNYVIRCFPLARQHSKASRYLHKAQQGWKNLIKCSDINLKQSKWFVHSMFYSYHKYITTSKPKHLQNMKNLFDSMFEQIFASPEVGNLEILEIWMRVLGNTKNFKEIHRICCESKQIVSHKKLVYPFSIVMELLENICLLKTSALDSNFKDNSLKSLFGVLCRMQRCADHPKLSFWHSYGNKCYSEVLLQIGDFDSLEKIHERSPNISYQLPGNYSQFCTQRSQDSLSSWTTISEVMEVNFAEVVFDFFITTDLQCITMNHSLEDVNQTSTSLKSVEQELAQSFDTLKSILIGDYQVHEDNIQIFGSKNCNQALLKERDARVLIVVQVKGTMPIDFSFKS